jgi:GTP-binding protein
MMDSNPIEHERGITILAKTTSIQMEGLQDQHRRYSGARRFRRRSRTDHAHGRWLLLVVDAYEGTMPQTRFVLKNALENHIKPIVVINKVDRPNADPKKAVDEVLDLFIQLGAPDDFSISRSFMSPLTAPRLFRPIPPLKSRAWPRFSI